MKPVVLTAVLHRSSVIKGWDLPVADLWGRFRRCRISTTGAGGPVGARAFLELGPGRVGRTPVGRRDRGVR